MFRVISFENVGWKSKLRVNIWYYHFTSVFFISILINFLQKDIKQPIKIESCFVIIKRTSFIQYLERIQLTIINNETKFNKRY